MWRQQSWLTVQQEFSDLGHADDVTRVVVRLIAAVALGGLPVKSAYACAKHKETTWHV
jgi:hypothetical protein